MSINRRRANDVKQALVGRQPSDEFLHFIFFLGSLFDFCVLSLDLSCLSLNLVRNEKLPGRVPCCPAGSSWKNLRVLSVGITRLGDKLPGRVLGD